MTRCSFRTGTAYLFVYPFFFLFFLLALRFQQFVSYMEGRDSPCILKSQ